ncbi:diadenylate cyclase CdaA [Aminithiophilus ramosus]|uniref:Diadenylate cyclase n=2 Tax=Synergistales TaxID=649776 RepID=A0A9Q7A4Q1_9BACT|nr:diadenylate cyclase CdaA [Aminithiophilus ramosus]QTX31291.1 diadenylate cyclase CdaA [Aminithiophilus ramosus]QVL35092.1 diadenylate cyclase CdaA [Synergistota bacterium]
MLGLFRWQDLLDIVIISFVVYRLLLLLVDTRAMQLVKGIFVLGLLAAAARVFELQALSWLLGKSLTALFIAIPIVFQPELRRVLEELGRGQIWQRRQAQERAEQLADEVTRALVYLQGQKIGALLVLERTTGLKDVWRTAVRLDAEISQELVVSLFWPNNPLHDGAVIVNKERILAAACYLPLTENSNLSRWLGTRHRAALGVTEVSDAMSLIVSEERGEISLGIKGHLSRGLKEKQVRRLLLHYFLAREEQKGGLLEQLRRELRELWPGSGGKNEI